MGSPRRSVIVTTMRSTPSRAHAQRFQSNMTRLWVPVGRGVSSSVDVNGVFHVEKVP